jgi:hypothetical protein
MTRIQVLRDARAEWVEKNIAAKEAIDEIYVREQNAVRDALLPFFDDFSDEVEVTASRGSVYFKMDHPEYSYKKELFNLYLRENWNFSEEEEGRKTFNGVDLSYYTTQTKGGDLWELNRLFLLGKVAGVVRWNQDEIVDAANKAVASFKEEYKVAHQLQDMISTAIRDIDVRIKELIKERVIFELNTNGVVFTKGVEVQLKYNYTPRILSIKLIDFSKSGKKATAVFVFAHGGSISREENCSVESIVEQVAHYYPNFVEDIAGRVVTPAV